MVERKEWCWKRRRWIIRCWLGGDYTDAFTDGDNEGGKDGVFVGSTDGWKDGAVVGTTVGTKEGDVVGTFVGDVGV